MAVEAWLCVGVGVGGALVLLLFLEMLQRNLAKASYRHQWGKRLWRKASIWPQRKKNAALKDILWTQQRFITLGKKKTHQTIEADLNLRGVGPVTLTQQGKMCGGKRYSKGKVLFMPLWFSFACVNMWFATVCRVCMCVGTHVCGCICLWRPGVAVGNHPGSLIESRSPHQTRNLPGLSGPASQLALECRLETQAGQDRHFSGSWGLKSRWALKPWSPLSTQPLKLLWVLTGKQNSPLLCRSFHFLVFTTKSGSFKYFNNFLKVTEEPCSPS